MRTLLLLVLWGVTAAQRLRHEPTLDAGSPAPQCGDVSAHWRSPIDVPRTYTPTHYKVSVRYRPWEAVALQHTSTGLQVNLHHGFNSFSAPDSGSAAGNLRLQEMVRARDGSGPGNFELTRLELRAPAAHRLAGQSSLLELQLWHQATSAEAGAAMPRAQDSNSTVISLLFDPSPNGPSQPLLARLRDALEVPLPPLSTRFLHGGAPLDLAALVPNGTGLLRYEGSEISPPCRRGVVWLIADAVAPVEEGLLQRLAFHLRIASQQPEASRHWPLGQRSLLRMLVSQ